MGLLKWSRTQRLFKAVEKGDSNRVVSLLEKHASVDRPNSDGFLPLDIAIINGKKETAQVLLEGGADANSPTVAGWRPLHLALTFPKGLSLAYLLIENGADVTAKTPEGYSPMHLVAINLGGIQEFVRHMLDRFLCEAVNKDIAKTEMTRLIEKSKLSHALARAVRSDDFVEMCENADAVTQYALQLVLVLEALLDHGAKVDVRSKDGASPLHEAAAAGNTSLVNILVEKGADVNGRDRKGETPLHRSVRCGKLEAVGLLIDLGAEVNAENRKGNTPMRLVGEWGEYEAIERLLRKHGGHR